MNIIIYSILLIFAFTLYMNWNFLINKIKRKKKENIFDIEKKSEVEILEIKNISKRTLMGNPRRDK